MTNEAMFSIVRAWQTAAAAATAAREAELKAREAMCAALFPDRATLDGTAYAALDGGWRLKGVFGTSYSVTSDGVKDVTNRIALRCGKTESDHVASTLFRWKPEVSITAYKLLSPTMLSIVDQVLTTKPKLPSFELVAPK